MPSTTVHRANSSCFLKAYVACAPGAKLDISANSQGTDVKLESSSGGGYGNMTAEGGPDVNVLNANIGCCGGDADKDKMPAPPPTNGTSS